MASSCFLVNEKLSCSPPLCYDGFVANDERCPHVLGRGFGPKPYKHLCDVWTTVKQELNVLDSVPKEHIDCVKILLSDLACCDETKHREGVPSPASLAILLGGPESLQLIEEFRGKLIPVIVHRADWNPFAGLGEPSTAEPLPVPCDGL